MFYVQTIIFLKSAPSKMHNLHPSPKYTNTSHQPMINANKETKNSINKMKTS